MAKLNEIIESQMKDETETVLERLASLESEVRFLRRSSKRAWRVIEILTQTPAQSPE